MMEEYDRIYETKKNRKNEGQLTRNGDGQQSW